MKYPLFFLILILYCGRAKSYPGPLIYSKPAGSITFGRIHKAEFDPKKAAVMIPDTGHLNNTGTVNVKDFGAKGDGIADDYLPIQAACNACIANPSLCVNVRFPVGNYRITRSIVLENIRNGEYSFFTIRLAGDAPAKSASDRWLSRIT